ncbi:ATP-binding protein [Streptomyces sp. NPDC046866]|uniref:ATP-binding protein n=1 Tax=Streptomyces sp. NPDC046866 TaxID=3154921 RepID=UPI003456B322
MGDPPKRHCECGGGSAAARAREEIRRFVRDAVHSGHPVPSGVADTALLVASELVTNAVRHAGGSCSLDLAWSGDGIDIDVTDPSPDPPRLRAMDPTGSMGGYGWRLVRRLAGEVDVRSTQAGGKTIHAHVPKRAA